MSKFELKKHGDSDLVCLFVEGIRVTKPGKLSGTSFTFTPVPRCGLGSGERTVRLGDFESEIFSKIKPRWIEARKTGRWIGLNFTDDKVGSVSIVKIDEIEVGTTKKIDDSVYHFIPFEGVNLPAIEEGVNADDLEIELAIAIGPRKPRAE